MCGRINLTVPSLAAIAAELGAVVDAADAATYRPRYNIAPTDEHWIVRAEDHHRHLQRAKWGVERGPRKIINAVGEKLGSTWKGAFSRHRSVGEAKQPIWFHRADGQLLLLAGLFDEAPGPGERPRFTIITTHANPLVLPVHDRMPAVLEADRVDAWLAAPRSELVMPAPEGVLLATPVSSRVNSVRNDDPSCLEPPAPMLV